MEAGNRCFDENVPEEINRRIVDHISDINLPYTEHSRRYLLSEGIKKDSIFVTGSPMTEVIHRNLERIKQSKILQQFGLLPDNYMVVSAHREENIDHEGHFFSLMNALNAVAEQYQMPLVYSTHPRSWKRIEERKFQFHPLIKKVRPLGFLDYNRLQLDAYCVLSDSGTLSEESAILGFPAVLIRTSTERPEVLDKGTVLIGGISERDIKQAIALCRVASVGGGERIIASDYLDCNVSLKVATLIQSCTKLVNRRV